MIPPTLPLLTPGEALQAFLQAQQVKQSELADRLGRSSQYITDIIKGKKAFDLELALELEGALPHFSADAWAQLALTYLREQQRQSGVLTRATVLNRQPVSVELIRHGWVEDDRDSVELERRLQHFWSHCDIACHFKSSTALATDQHALQAWSIQVYLLAQRQELPPYEPARMPQLIKDLQKILAVPGAVTKVADIVRSYGIAVVLLPHLPRCPVDGVAAYNAGHPYLGLSLRHGKLDQFWFTVFHELAHIEKQHDAVSIDVDVFKSGETNANEEEANRIARDNLIENEAYLKFLRLGKTDIASINRFAYLHNIHPSILLGRLKFEKQLTWKQYAREHVSVREYLF